MAKAFEQIGAVDCHSCGKNVPLKKQRNGLASYSCPWCGFQGTCHYEESSKHLLKRAGIDADAPTPAAEPEPVETPAAPPEPKPEKQPAAKPKNIWGIEEE